MKLTLGNQYNLAQFIGLFYYFIQLYANSLTLYFKHSNTYYPYSILGGGLPDRKDECRRGQLVVTFVIKFPERITPHVSRLAEAIRESQKLNGNKWKGTEEDMNWRRKDDQTRK